MFRVSRQHLSVRAQVLGLAAWLAAGFLAAAIGAVASIQAPAFYLQLQRPAWAPPPFVFGPVWSLLYFLMSVAAWLVWRKAGFAGARFALLLYLLQLALNALWSWLFFGWHLGAAAFADVVLLAVCIAWTTAAFRRVQVLAAGLLLPYLFWVCFAAALNYAIWQLNPALLG